MNWEDKGIVLSVKPWSESCLLTTLITEHHGLFKGILRKTKSLNHLQPGTFVLARWKARLSDHLGTYSIEIEDIPFVRLFSFPERILFLKLVSTMLNILLPERHPYPILWDEVSNQFAKLHHPSFDVYYEYLHFEMLLLSELGFGLDLSQCAVCFKKTELKYISPRTGKIACTSCGKPYEHKLFQFDVSVFNDNQGNGVSFTDYKNAFSVTHHFFTTYAMKDLKVDFPILREQFIQNIRSHQFLKIA